MRSRVNYAHSDGRSCESGRSARPRNSCVNTNASLEKVADIFQESDAYYVLGIERDPSASPPRDGLSRSRLRAATSAYAQRQFFTPGQTPRRVRRAQPCPPATA
jgi:hypothetical protein